MLILYETEIRVQGFGTRIEGRPQFAVMTEKEIDDSKMSADFFFRYMGAAWRQCIAEDPRCLIVVHEPGVLDRVFNKNKTMDGNRR